MKIPTPKYSVGDYLTTKKSCHYGERVGRVVRIRIEIGREDKPVIDYLMRETGSAIEEKDAVRLKVDE